MLGIFTHYFAKIFEAKSSIVLILFFCTSEPSQVGQYLRKFGLPVNSGARGKQYCARSRSRDETEALFLIVV